MKLNCKNENQARTGVGAALEHDCYGSCRKVPAQIRAAKNAIFAESYDALQTQECLLRLALNEAEALAWETKYPQLVFPALATEKVQAVIAWNRRQQALYARTSYPDRQPKQPLVQATESNIYLN